MEKIGVHIDDTRTTDVEVFARCPGHKKRTGHPDRSPSWSINRETGKHWCFSCGYGGDAQSLVMDMLDIGPWDAIKMIGAWGREPGGDLAIVGRKEKEELLTVPEDYLDGFIDPPASRLAERGLTKAAVRRHGVRYDYAKDAWILPIRTPTGDLMGYQIKAGSYVRNRPARNAEEPGVQKGETWFGWHLLQGKRPIVVESPLDVVRLASVGIPDAIAVMGQHPTTAQMNLLLRRDCAEVILALDNDREGHIAIERLIMKWATRITMSIFKYGDIDAKDPGDMSREEIEWAIANRYPASKWSRVTAGSVANP